MLTTLPFDALLDLKALLEQQWDATKALERATGQIIPHIFHRNGKPIKSYRHAWTRACDEASKSDGKNGTLVTIIRPQIAGRIVHDFRRTAVRNLVRAGVDEHLAMKLTGHKTRAIFDRYNITNEADLRAGVEKLAEYLNPTKSQVRERMKGTTGAQSRIRRIGRGGR